jgi:glycosyltransferase involved in cell wall biosynthesis
MRVWVLTPTGGRREAFALCKRYVDRQTFDDFTWVVVDDCIPAEEDVPANIVLHPEPEWKPGQQTVARNVREGLRCISQNCGPDDLVVFMEDDDWYHPEYVERFVALALDLPKDVEIFGEGWTIYYNIVCRRYHVHANAQHASLCATAMRGSFLETAISVCDYVESIGKFTVDMECFKAANRSEVVNTNYSLGIKGLPGRVGCCSGHRPEVMGFYRHDPSFSCMRTWIGEDAATYESYYRPNLQVEARPLEKKRPLRNRRSGIKPIIVAGDMSTEIRNKKRKQREEAKKPKIRPRKS